MTDYIDRIICGDCLDVMRGLPDGCVDAVVTDPPYGLSFMGKDWDHGVPGEAFWREALRVAKPGAHLLAFGGTRTHHRLMCAIEDAGWEIRDCLGWLYGSGFPKSLDVSKAIDKMAGAEREVIKTPITSKSTAGKGTSNELDERPWLTKARIQGFHEHAGPTPVTPEAVRWQGWGTALKPAWEPIVLARKPLLGTVAQNVLEHGTGALNIDGCRVEGKYKWRASDSSNTTGASFNAGSFGDGPNAQDRFPANLIHDGSDEVEVVFPKNASRFFYCAKASSSERGEGNNHPTVKPQALMQYLCRLVTPPGGVVLDPFAGSGSTLLAALREGFCFIGIEKEEKYCEIARRRVAEATPSLFAGVPQ